MGRGRCILSDKDLVILELLYRNKAIRLVSIADVLNTKIPIIKDNLARLQRLGLIEREARVEKSGVGSYYSMTEQGKMIYNILKKDKESDTLEEFFEYINSINNPILNRLYHHLISNKDKIMTFNSKDYEDKEFVIRAYEELKRMNGEHFIAYAKGVEEDTLRIKINDNEWHDLMISYITENGNTRIIVNCSFDEVLAMVRDKLGFSDPRIFINEMIRLRHAISRVNYNLAIPFVLGKGVFVVIGFKDKGIFINDRKATEILEEYFRSLWRDGMEFKELDDYLKEGEKYVSECIANYIEGTAYANNNQLLYNIADKLKSCNKEIIRDVDDTIIDAYKEMNDKQYLQYIIIDKNNPKMLELSIDYALTIGNTKILTNDKVYKNARMIDEPLISVIISNNFAIIPYRDRYIFTRDAMLIDLLKEYFLTLWSNANEIDFREIDDEELNRLIDDARKRMKSIGIT